MSTTNKREESPQTILKGIKLPICLIGARFVGKSTVGRLLASHLQLPFIDLKDICQQYWQEIGYDEEQLEQAWSDNQADGVYHYLMPFEAHAIARGIEEHPNCVIELGGLQSVFNPQLLPRVASILESCQVVLLLLSDNIEESLAILQERERVIIHGREINEHFIRHHSNYDLANYTFYTKDKTPEQTRDEILRRLDFNASDIILIGAMGAGKSTIGKLLAQKLGLPQVSMDRLRWKYYQEVGWSREQQQQIAAREGFAGVYHYWKQYDLYALERLLNEHQNCVIDFGAGHSIYEDPADLLRARQLLAPYSNVVLLIPSPDVDESLTILHQRNQLIVNDLEVNRFIITQTSHTVLAKQIVYTKDKTPAAIKDEILANFALEYSSQQ